MAAAVPYSERRLAPLANTFFLQPAEVHPRSVAEVLQGFATSRRRRSHSSGGYTPHALGALDLLSFAPSLEASATAHEEERVGGTACYEVVFDGARRTWPDTDDESDPESPRTMGSADSWTDTTPHEIPRQQHAVAAPPPGRRDSMPVIVSLSAEVFGPSGPAPVSAPQHQCQLPVPAAAVAPSQGQFELSADPRQKLMENRRAKPAREEKQKSGAGDAVRKAGVTTLMIRNLPEGVLQPTVLAELDTTGFAGLYDFAYLPSDFESLQSKGYGFVNFVSVAVADAFAAAWHKSKHCGAEAPCLNVSPASIQGCEANIKKWSGPRVRRIRNPALRPFVRKGTAAAAGPPTGVERSPTAGADGRPLAWARGAARPRARTFSATDVAAPMEPGRVSR